MGNHNSTYTALIIDGTLNSQNFIKKCIDDYVSDIQIIGVSKSAFLGVKLLKSFRPDILFLGDVLVEGEAKEVLMNVDRDFGTQIIHLVSQKGGLSGNQCSHDNIKSFLIKPFVLNDMVLSIEKCKKELYGMPVNSMSHKKKVSSDLIGISSLMDLDIYKSDQIFYLEANGRYTCFHLSDGNSKIACKTLGDYEEILDQSSFFRIHNSYIINYSYLKCITKIGKNNYCVMFNGLEIPISRRRKEGLKYFMAMY